MIHQGIIQRFFRLEQNNRLAHAYLFIGPRDIGKTQTALEICKLLNCEDIQNSYPCQQCSTCLKISHGNHPDIHVVDREETETIKIEQIRELISQIQLRAFESKWKIFIIRNIERLTLEGANALLKTVEEPVKDTLIILTSSIIEEIPDTIRSRCHIVHFFPTSYKKLALGLSKDYAIAQPQAGFLAYYSQGCLGRAQGLIDQKFFERKDQILNSILFSPDNETYFKEILVDKEKTKETLNILLLWFRDLLILKVARDTAPLVYGDRLKDLRRDELRYSFIEINDLIQEIVKARELLEENLNVKIALSLMKERLCRK